MSISHSRASERKFFQIKIESEQGTKFTLTTTLFRPSEAKKFNNFYQDISVNFNGNKVATNIVFQVDPKIREWSAPFTEGHHFTKVAIPLIPKEKIDKVGAMVALVRTAYSTVFWIIIGDFDWLQSGAMLGLQAALHYSFTYKGWGLNILNTAKQLGNKVIEKTKNSHLSQSKWFHNSIKYMTGFMTSNLIGVGFMGVIAWDDFIQTFSTTSVYSDIAFYSVMSLFATGGWNNFLSDQKFSPKPFLSQKVIQRIYQFNGVLMAVAFPLMMNGYHSGTALLGITGLTGLFMMIKGDDLNKIYKKLTYQLKCQRLYWQLLQESKKR